MILFGLFSLSATIWLIKIYVQNRKAIKNKDQLKFLNILFIGIIMSQFVGSFAPAVYDLSMSHLQLFIMGNFGIVLNVCLIIVGVSFITVNKKPWLLQRQKNYFMIIYSKTGIPLYSKSFREDIDDLGMNLLSGAFTAITSIFQESAKVAEPIEAILFHGKQLKVIEKSSFYCMIMVDYSTTTSDIALEEFTRKIETEFGQKIASFNGDTAQFRPIDLVFDQYFS